MPLSDSNPFSVTIQAPAGGAPAWFTAMADKTWAAIAGGTAYGSAYQNGTRLADVSPTVSGTAFGQWRGNEGPRAIINDWTGGIASQTLKEVYLAAEGGHAGYYNTEIYALKLTDAVPSWSRIWAQDNTQILTTDQGFNPPNFSHADGNPRTFHGFNASRFVDNNGRIWLTAVGADPAGHWGTNTYSIDRNNLTATTPNWMFHGRLFPNISQPNTCFEWQAGAGAFDPITNRIWKAADAAVDCGTGSNGVFSIDCAATVGAGQQSLVTGPGVPGSTIYNTYMPGPGWGGWSAILKDRTPRCWVVGTEQGGRNVMLVMDVVNAPGVWNQVATTGTGRWGSSDGGVYHAASNAFLVFEVAAADGAGGIKPGTSPTVYKLAVSPGSPLTATYTWSQVTNHPSNTVVPATDQGNQYQGTFSKLQLINDMGNGQGALVEVCGFNGPTFVYKLPLAGV